MFNELNAKNRIENSLFFSEIFLEYKETELPQGYLEREKNQAYTIKSLKEIFYKRGNILGDLNKISLSMFMDVSVHVCIPERDKMNEYIYR